MISTKVISSQSKSRNEMLRDIRTAVSYQLSAVS
jgi:hypothetical protein